MLQSTKNDINARKKYTKAFETKEKASLLIEKSKEDTNNSMTKVANRKRAILSSSMGDFLEIYDKIIKIEFTAGEGIIELFNGDSNPLNVEEIRSLSAIATSPISTNDFAGVMIMEGAKGCIIGLSAVSATAMITGTTLTGSLGVAAASAIGGGVATSAGLGVAAVLGPVGLVAGVVVSGAFAVNGVLNSASEQNLKQASNENKIANVEYLNAENMSMALGAISTRCDKTADILAKLNVLFVKSLKESDKIIEQKGYTRKNYDVDDRKVIMTAINLADTIKKIIDTPILDTKGELTQASLEVLDVGICKLAEKN